jgi:hypothetical protein
MFYRLIPQAEFKPFRKFFQNRRNCTQGEAEQSNQPEADDAAIKNRGSFAAPVIAVVVLTSHRHPAYLSTPNVAGVLPANRETLSTCGAFLPALETRQDVDGRTQRRLESVALCRFVFAPVGPDGLRRRVYHQSSDIPFVQLCDPLAPHDWPMNVPHAPNMLDEVHAIAIHHERHILQLCQLLKRNLVRFRLHALERGHQTAFRHICVMCETTKKGPAFLRGCPLDSCKHCVNLFRCCRLVSGVSQCSLDRLSSV